MLVAVVSCKEETAEYLPSYNVSFSPVVTANTRAQSGQYPQEVPFGVWIYSLPQKHKWEKNSAQATPLLENSIVTYNNGEWTNTPVLVWPKKQNLTVFAYSPLEVNASYSKQKGLEINNLDVTDGVYPLFTNPIADCSSKYCGGCIALPFVPSLSKVEFRVRSMAQMDSLLCLRSLTIDKIHYKGTFQSLPQASWTPANETMKLEFCSGCVMIENTSQTIGTQMVLPQAVSQPVELVVDVYNKDGVLIDEGRKITSRLIECNWNVGKYYTYTLNLTTDSVTFTTDIFDNYDARFK